MIDLRLTAVPADPESVVVGYTCPCGCTPAVTYRHGGPTATEGCCCGNQMAVGAEAPRQIVQRPGYEVRSASVEAPWRETVPVVWAIGPSTHPEPDAHEHHGPGATPVPDTAIDPVCGMTVGIPLARAKDLHTRYRDTDYYFCGKGCKLDFIDDPEPYLAPGYVPSM